MDHARNVLAVPIMIADKAVGESVARSRRISYGNDEIRVVGAMADQCALALTTARLVREFQLHHTELAQAGRANWHRTKCLS